MNFENIAEKIQNFLKNYQIREMDQIQKNCKKFRNLSMTATFDSRFSCRITFWIRKYHRLHLDQPKTGLLPLVSTVATFYYIQLMPAIFYSEH